jgi:hypothetical protein
MLTSLAVFIVALGLIVQSAVVSAALSQRIFHDIRVQWQVLIGSFWRREKFLVAMRQRHRHVASISARWGLIFVAWDVLMLAVIALVYRLSGIDSGFLRTSAAIITVFAVITLTETRLHEALPVWMLKSIGLDRRYVSAERR